MLRVVVGVIFNELGEILISKRNSGKFKQGFWEFAGGKVEAGESLAEAIIRELNEELGIISTKLSYKFNFDYHYPEKSVKLHIFSVEQYSGEITDNENQELKWVKFNELKNFNILPTVMPIINRLLLPRIYHIINFDEHFWHNFNAKLPNIKMLQLRSDKEITAINIKKVYHTCQERQIKLILNIPNIKNNLNWCDGYHIKSKNLESANIYPNKIISCATHNKKEVKLANDINADIITLGPVKPTNTHIDAKHLGFTQAQNIAKDGKGLVYFLGGLSTNDIANVLDCGGFGIAGISKI